MATAALAPMGVPGPHAFPPIGWRVNAFRFLSDPLRYMQRTYDAYGEIAGLVRSDTRQIFAIGPQYNRQLLTDAGLFYSIFETITPERIKKRRRQNPLRPRPQRCCRGHGAADQALAANPVLLAVDCARAARRAGHALSPHAGHDRQARRCDAGADRPQTGPGGRSIRCASDADPGA